jgi:hypothetical protein
VSVLFAITGLVLGAAAGGLHLAITRARTKLVLGGHTGASFALLPLGFVAIAGAVIAAARVDRQAAWLVPVGILAVRFAMLRSWMEER